MRQARECQGLALCACDLVEGWRQHANDGVVGMDSVFRFETTKFWLAL